MKNNILHCFMMLAICLFFSTLTACAIARGVHDLTPNVRNSMAIGNCVTQVELYRQGETPKKPGYRVATVAAHGNGYANQDTLEKTIIEEANKVCADFIVLVGHKISKDETIGTYGGGIMMSDQIRRPHLYGIAYRYSKVALGINLNKEGIIEYVRSGSVAEKNGIIEGMKLLTVNGTFIKSDAFILDKEILMRNPGDQVRIEILDKDGKKQMKEFILEALMDQK